MAVVDVLEFGGERVRPDAWINTVLNRFLAAAEEGPLPPPPLQRSSASVPTHSSSPHSTFVTVDDAAALRFHLASVLQSLSQV